MLDYVNLLERTIEYDSDYVLITEDDMLPANHALDKALLTSRSWLHVAVIETKNVKAGKGSAVESTTSGLGGACSLAYRSEDVPGLIEFLKKDPYDKPVDLKISEYFVVKRKKRKLTRVPNLFQHMCLNSTYTGEVIVTCLLSRGGGGGGREKGKITMICSIIIRMR